MQTYPDEASRLRLAEFGDQPAVRMLQGIPHAVETVGGFVVWDGGWFMQSIIGVWAVLTTSRLLRGEEDSGRAELVGAGPVPASQVTNSALLVVLAGCVAAGLAAFGAIVIPSEDVVGAVLFGAGAHRLRCRDGCRHSCGVPAGRRATPRSGPRAPRSWASPSSCA